MPKRVLTDYDLQLIDQHIDIKLDDKFEAFEKKINKKQDKIITILDAVMGEVQAFHQTEEIHAQDHKSIHDRLDRIEHHAGLD